MQLEWHERDGYFRFTRPQLSRYTWRITTPFVLLECCMPATRFRPNFVNRPDSGLAIAVSGLSKTYAGSRGKPSHLALDAVDLQVPAGCIFGLLGPNGAGKSTLINILAGTVVKTSGTAIVWGTDIDDNPRQARANIGIVPQELNVDAFFTPRQTIDLMAGLTQSRTPDRRYFGYGRAVRTGRYVCPAAIRRDAAAASCWQSHGASTADLDS